MTVFYGSVYQYSSVLYCTCQHWHTLPHSYRHVLPCRKKGVTQVQEVLYRRNMNNAFQDLKELILETNYFCFVWSKSFKEFLDRMWFAVIAAMIYTYILPLYKDKLQTVTVHCFLHYVLSKSIRHPWDHMIYLCVKKKVQSLFQT